MIKKSGLCPAEYSGFILRRLQADLRPDQRQSRVARPRPALPLGLSPLRGADRGGAPTDDRDGALDDGVTDRLGAGRGGAL